jgi:hypothetical protein
MPNDLDIPTHGAKLRIDARFREMLAELTRLRIQRKKARVALRTYEAEHDDPELATLLRIEDSADYVFMNLLDEYGFRRAQASTAPTGLTGAKES